MAETYYVDSSSGSDSSRGTAWEGLTLRPNRTRSYNLIVNGRRQLRVMIPIYCLAFGLKMPSTTRQDPPSSIEASIRSSGESRMTPGNVSWTCLTSTNLRTARQTNDPSVQQKCIRKHLFDNYSNEVVDGSAINLGQVLQLNSVDSPLTRFRL